MNDKFDDLEDFEEVPSTEYETESREILLAHYMASLGFRPKVPLAKDTLEYARTYADPSGRIGRTVAVIAKDDMGLEPTRPEYFAITIQIHLPATEEDVKAKSPAFARADLLRILAHFDVSPEDRMEPSLTECKLCAIQTAEFIERAGARICMDCARRKGIT